MYRSLMENTFAQNVSTLVHSICETGHQASKGQNTTRVIAVKLAVCTGSSEHQGRVGAYTANT